MNVSNNTGEERTLELPVIFYKAYRGKENRTEPLYWRAAELVSLTGFILAVAFFIREKYRLEKGTKLFLNG